MITTASTLASIRIYRCLFFPNIWGRLPYMREFQKHRTTKKSPLLLLAHAAGLLVLCIVTVFMARAAFGMYSKLNRAALGQQEARAQLALLEEQKKQVAATVEGFASDRGVEAQIRQRFGVARPGEGEIQIVREAPKVEMVAAPESWWRRVLRVLFVW